MKISIIATVLLFFFVASVLAAESPDSNIPTAVDARDNNAVELDNEFTSLHSLDDSVDNDDEEIDALSVDTVEDDDDDYIIEADEDDAELAEDGVRIRSKPKKCKKKVCKKVKKCDKFKCKCAYKKVVCGKKKGVFIYCNKYVCKTCKSCKKVKKCIFKKVKCKKYD